MIHQEDCWDSDQDHMIDQQEEEGVIMELGVEVCMTECDEEVMDMMVVCVSNEHRFCCHFLNIPDTLSRNTEMAVISAPTGF